MSERYIDGGGNIPVRGSEVQQITKANFIRLGIAAFKEHELREIVATFCRLPGIAPQSSEQVEGLHKALGELHAPGMGRMPVPAE